ncbi:MAG: PrgI family protein [Patescibacteria group bacterium]
MRTRIIPAQITTVEDKIAGNLNFTQLLLLIAPVFLGTVSYALVAPVMQLAWYKIAFFVLSVVACGGLALRIKDRLVLHWLITLARYNLRPRYYVFTKADNTFRKLYVPLFKRKVVKKEQNNHFSQKKHLGLNLNTKDLVAFEYLVSRHKVAPRFILSKKGGLDVVIE